MNRVLSKMLGAVLRGRFVALAAVAGLGLLLAATGANAGCGIPYKGGKATGVPFFSPLADDDRDESASIVGLWHLNYTATSVPIPGAQPPFSLTPPFPFLESYKTWHADGTEFENAFLPPAGGNVCFGVWKELKDGSIKLHHIGLMFDATSGAISAVFTVDEVNTVAANGKTYAGTFDFKLFPPSDVYGTGTPIAEIRGTTAGTRISVP